MKPSAPGPSDSFVLRIAGKVMPCEDCGVTLFHQLPPRAGIERFGCNGCGAAYLFWATEPPKLLEN